MCLSAKTKSSTCSVLVCFCFDFCCSNVATVIFGFVWSAAVRWRHEVSLCFLKYFFPLIKVLMCTIPSHPPVLKTIFMCKKWNVIIQRSLFHLCLSGSLIQLSQLSRMRTPWTSCHKWAVFVLWFYWCLVICNSADTYFILQIMWHFSHDFFADFFFSYFSSPLITTEFPLAQSVDELWSFCPHQPDTLE